MKLLADERSKLSETLDRSEFYDLRPVSIEGGHSSSLCHRYDLVAKCKHSMPKYASDLRTEGGGSHVPSLYVADTSCVACCTATVTPMTGY